MERKKKKNRTIDGNATFLSPGLYELSEPIENSYLVTGTWPTNTRFIVKKHVERIGVQEIFQYFSIRLADKSSYIVKSYEEKWNIIANRLQAVVEEDIESYVKKVSNSVMNTGVLLIILDQLEQMGKITRDDIRSVFLSMRE